MDETIERLGGKKVKFQILSVFAVQCLIQFLHGIASFSAHRLVLDVPIYYT